MREIPHIHFKTNSLFPSRREALLFCFLSVSLTLLPFFRLTVSGRACGTRRITRTLPVLFSLQHVFEMVREAAMRRPSWLWMLVVLCSVASCPDCEAKKHKKDKTEVSSGSVQGSFEGDEFAGDEDRRLILYPPILCPSMRDITIEGEYLCLSTEGVGAINTGKGNGVTYFAEVRLLQFCFADLN